MVGPGTPVRITATGSVHAGPVGVCYGLSLTAGVDAASAAVRVEGSGGAIVLTLKAAANTTAPWFPPAGMRFSDLHVTFTGTSPELTALI